LSNLIYKWLWSAPPPPYLPLLIFSSCASTIPLSITKLMIGCDTGVLLPTVQSSITSTAERSTPATQ
jgi:hypothetical protein